MPTALGEAVHSLHQREHAACLIQVARIGCRHQHGIQLLQRYHPHQAGQRAAALAAEQVLHCRGEVLCSPRRHRQQRVGAAGQLIHVESLRQLDQRLARVRLGADQQRVAPRIGGYARTAAREWLDQPRERVGGGEAQRHHGGAARRAGAWHDAVDAVVQHHRGPVLAQQHLQRRQQLRTRNRICGVQRRRSLHRGIDRVGQVQHGSEHLGRDLANVGIDEVERDIAAIGTAEQWRSRAATCVGCGRGAIGELRRGQRLRRTDAAVLARRRGDVAGDLRQRRQRAEGRRRRMRGAGGKRERNQQGEEAASSRTDHRAAPPIRCSVQADLHASALVANPLLGTQRSPRPHPAGHANSFFRPAIGIARSGKVPNRHDASAGRTTSPGHSPGRSGATASAPYRRGPRNSRREDLVTNDRWMAGDNGSPGAVIRSRPRIRGVIPLV